MALTRRDFVRRISVGGAGLASASLIIGYGHEELTAIGEEAWLRQPPPASMPDVITLSSNENLRGPGPKVIDVLKRHPSRHLGFGYPPLNRAAFEEAVAAAYGVRTANVLVATGSGAILRAAQEAYVTGERPLVSGNPSYLRADERPVPVDATLGLDLDAMVDHSVGAGLVFICNPNNPTSTVHTRTDIERAVRDIKRRSPETAVLVDEAYIEYATATGVGTATELALEMPDVLMTRTFSKAYGMAGMRMGYAVARPETLRKLSQAWGLGSINELQAVAGVAALEDTAHMQREREENARVRDWTLAQLEELGYGAPASQTNFVFVNIGRPASWFRDACRERGVLVGRDFPPLEKTYARISLGRMEDMERAMVVFREVLGPAGTRQ